MEQPLIAPAWRRGALAGGLLGLAVFLSLAVLVFHARRTAFDSWAFRVLPERIAPTRGQFLIEFTEPAISVLLLALIVVLAVSVRRFDLAALAVLGPALGTVLASDVVKPLVDRRLFNGTVGSYPSGHETGVTCTATVLLVAFGQLPLRRAARYALSVVLGIWVLVAAVGLTRFYYHYATDTIGAMGLSVALMLGLAALLDRVRAGRSRTPRAQHASAQRTPSQRPPSRPSAPTPQAGRPRPGRHHRPRPGHRHRPRPLPVTRPDDQLTPRA